MKKEIERIKVIARINPRYAASLIAVAQRSGGVSNTVAVDLIKELGLAEYLEICNNTLIPR